MKSLRMRWIFGCVSSVLMSGAVAATPFAERAEVQDFLAGVAAEHDLELSTLNGWVGELSPSEAVLELISKPAEKVLTWPDYRAIFIGEQRIGDGRAFSARYSAELARAEQTYGVPSEVIAAIIGVESFYGRLRGKHSVLQALLTLGFDYPRRAEFFKSELEAFLVLTHEEGWNAPDVLGSYAGAMGWPQFISSSYRMYAVDFDGDGQRDLLGNPVDVIGSVANYLALHGWEAGEPIARRWPEGEPPEALQTLASDELKPNIKLAQLGPFGLDRGVGGKANLFVVPDPEGGEQWWVSYRNFYAITRYNHSRLYAMAVHELANSLRSEP